jgi:predicted nucleic acid-binding protein
MIAVSNTTPLRYLLVIRQQDLLQKLLEKVLIPRAVFEELTDPHTPSLVRAVVSSLPAWISVQEVAQLASRPGLGMLHRGEEEAVLLAEMVHPDFCSWTHKRDEKRLCGEACPLLGP